MPNQWFEDVDGVLHCIGPGDASVCIRGKSDIYVVEGMTKIALSRTPNHANWALIRKQIAEGAHLIECPDLEDPRVGDSIQVDSWPTHREQRELLEEIDENTQEEHDDS